MCRGYIGKEESTKMELGILFSGSYGGKDVA